ncbi:MAG TPA: hypothetical protein DIW20_02730 [Rhodospirillaceae bacterium]|nr:hypothetical protein [Rhodospirillaceae bacterium]
MAGEGGTAAQNICRFFGADCLGWLKQGAVMSITASITKALGQRIFFTIFLAIAGLGGLPVILSYAEGLASYRYAEVSCEILRNKWIKKQDGDYKLDLEYRYEVGGEVYTGTRYLSGLDNLSNQRLRDIRRPVKQLQPGAKAYCYVNPRNPAQSVVERGSVHPWHHAVLLGMLLLVGLWGFLTAFFMPDWAEENMIMDGDSSGD